MKIDDSYLATDDQYCKFLWEKYDMLSISVNRFYLNA